MPKWLSTLLVSLVMMWTVPAAPPTGLKVPEGFVIEEFAGPDLANDIHTLHIDSRGRVVVAGRGYVRELIVDKPGLRAARSRDLLPAPRDGPMGLLWEGTDFYIVSDGGLRKYRDVTGEGPPKANPELLLALKTGGEHDAHAVRRGPDGRLYLLCGNNAQISKVSLSQDSPVKQPIAGGLLRLSRDGKEVQCLADGFRNPYDFDFNLDGEPFTFDSDNERCIGLPWYEETRFYHIRHGGNYGWLNPQHGQFWRKPAYFPDVVAPICTLGRGSPTAVTAYRHNHFPQHYRGGFFLADWTFGRIWFVPLQSQGESYTGQPELFLESSGETGFAPTGMAVHPGTGELYVSIGGRGTRGGVYRIGWTARRGPGEPLPIRERDHPAWKPLKPERPRELASVADVRRLQLFLGDIGSAKAAGTWREGYSFRQPTDSQLAQECFRAIAAVFPAGQADLDRELSRTAAALGQATPRFLSQVLAELAGSKNIIDAVHYLHVLATLADGPLSAEQQKKLAGFLVQLDGEYERRKLGRDRHWPLRLTECVSELLRRQKGLAAHLIDAAEFGQPTHGWLVNLPELDGPAVARRLLARARQDKDFTWTPGLLQRLAALPDADVHDLAAKLARIEGLDEAALTLLARSPRPEEYELYLNGLKSASSRPVEIAARALAQLPAGSGDADWLEALRALRRFSDEKRDAAVQKALLGLLQKRTQQTFPARYAAWETWVKQTRPELLKPLAVVEGFDAEAWSKRLAAVDWERGDPTRGRAVFSRASCAGCHNGGSAVGPSLDGVGKRFSRDDLFTAILEPSREISPRYRTTRIATLDGKSYEGLVIYDAPDGVILQVGVDQTIRIAGHNLDSRQPGRNSLMPAGLLDKLTPADLADLYAYMKKLGTQE